MIHELRFCGHKSSYEVCRRMELLPTDAHRIVALAEIHTFDIFKAVLPDLFCDLHGEADSTCDSMFLARSLKISLKYKFSRSM